MLEARAKGASHNDKRALALSYGSRLILEKLGVWDDIEAKATAINTIHISQRGGFGRTKLSATEHDLPALGYVLSYGALTQALDEKLDISQVQYEAEATQIKPGEPFVQVTFNDSQILQSQLIVVADGGRSLGEIEGIQRETKEYGHDALVTKVRAELPHNRQRWRERSSAPRCCAGDDGLGCSELGRLGSHGDPGSSSRKMDSLRRRYSSTTDGRWFSQRCSNNGGSATRSA